MKRWLGTLLVALAATTLSARVVVAAGQLAGPSAGPATVLPPNATFSHLTIDDGLADPAAPEITQDAEGFMWFGTFNGLDRYDGYQFAHFRHDDADEHSLSGNVITALYTDRRGTVWVGARGAGLNRFDPRTEQFDTFRHVDSNRDSLANDSPHMLYEDSAGVIWVATEGGLSRFDRGTQTFTNYQHDDANPASLSNNAVRSVAGDPSGALWVGTADGLNRFDPTTETFHVYRHDPNDPHSLGNNGIWKIVVDRSGVVWIATESGLDRLDQKTDRFRHYRHDPSNPHSLSFNGLDALMLDDRGRLWVGTFGGGISILNEDHETFTVYRHDPGDTASLSYDVVDKLFLDRSGLIWIGTAGGGINMYNPQQQAVRIYRPVAGSPDSVTSSFVSATLEDRDGGIWIGTRSQGLDRLDPRSGSVSHFPVQPGVAGQLGFSAITDLAQDATGALWIGTFGGGLYRRDPTTGSFTEYRHDAADPSSLSNDNVRRLRFDEVGTLWVATGGGLNRFDSATGMFTAYRANLSDPNALSTDLLVGLDIDRNGDDVWVGTSGEGLQRLDVATGKWTRYRHNAKDPSSLSEDNVFAVHVDRAGFVWVGTQGGGLNRLDPATGIFTHYHHEDGLASERVQSIVEDGQASDATPGNLWVVTDRGVTRLDHDRRTLQTYNATNGLPGAQYTQGSDIGRDGKLLLGNLGGLVVFDAEAIRNDATVPPIVFTDFRVDNKLPRQSIVPRNIDYVERVELPFTARVVSFEFAALNYRAPDSNRYRYMLEGFDRDWIEVDATRRLATYTNLDPGTYVFRVTGSNADGAWNPTGRSVELTVTPPWWGTVWSRGAAAVLSVGALAFAYVWRERTLRAQQRRLESVVAVRTRELQAALTSRDTFLRTLAHDLKTPLSSINWQVQLVIRRVRDGTLDTAALNERLALIGAGATEASMAIDELHDLTRLAAGETLPLHLETFDLVRLAEDRVHARSVSSTRPWQFESAEERVLVEADRVRLGRALDNLLDNAARYSAPEQAVTISVSTETIDQQRCGVVRVRDHGIGIPRDDLPHIFEPYRRGSNTGAVDGEGLGLASARQLIALHHGDLSVVSEEGAGSTFTIRLPLLDSRRS